MADTIRIEIFNRICREHITFLKSVLWKLTADEDLFADALQNALLAIWKNTNKLRGERAKGYLYRIALSSSSKAWRQRAGKNGELPQHLANSTSNPEELARKHEQNQMLRRAITRLPVKQAKALTMRYFQYCDYEEIAKELGCKESAARLNVSRAIAKLRKCEKRLQK